MSDDRPVQLFTSGPPSTVVPDPDPVASGALRDALAVTLAAAKDIAVVAMIALIVIALLMAKTMAGMSRKLLSLIVFAALAFGVWNQRQSLQTCADKVETSGVGRTCRFFGNDITIDSPLNG